MHVASMAMTQYHILFPGLVLSKLQVKPLSTLECNLNHLPPNQKKKITFIVWFSLIWGPHGAMPRDFSLVCAQGSSFLLVLRRPDGIHGLNRTWSAMCKESTILYLFSILYLVSKISLSKT